MPTTEIVVPDKLETEISQLVAQDEFLNREQAIEELLSMGISAYDTSGATTDEIADDVFTQSREDQRDPALEDDQPSDEYPF